MPRDGSNTYSLPEAPFVANTPALASAVNSNFSDIATALTDSFTRAETTSFSRTLLDDANAAAACQTLGVGWERLAVRVIASGTWEDFGLDTAFHQFQLLVTRGGPSATAFGTMQLSQNNGATWISAAGSYINTQLGSSTAGAPTGSGPTSATTAYFTPTILAASSAGYVSGIIDIDPGAASHLPMIRSDMTVLNASSTYITPAVWSNAAYCVTAGRVNRIRLGWSAGNWDGVGRTSRVILLGMRAP